MDVTYSICSGRQHIARIHHHRPARQTGLSLLELVTTLSLIFIVLGLVIPGYRNVIGINRLASQVNHLSASLAYTRTEAIKRNQQVVLCKSHDGQTCVRKGSWQQGWLIFADEDNNERREENETILLHHPGFTSHVKMDYSAFGSRHYFVYRPSGVTKNNGTFVFCEQTTHQARALIVNRVGRVRVSDKTCRGKPIICKPETS